MPVSKNLTNSSSGERGHVLLVSPLTFSYHESISETLVSLGYAVTWWNDRASNSTWYKIALRLFPSLTAKLSERFFLKRLDQIDSSSISHVLVIKGEGVSPDVALKLREKFRSASMGFYLWDGIDNVTQALDILPAFDSVATFDPDDAKKYGWTYRPLFWRNISVAANSVSSPSYDWCFIGTIHSDRHRVIHRLRERYKNDFQCFVFCYFQSPLILLFRKILDRTLWSAPDNSLSTKPKSASDVALIVANSKAVLDVEHPKQRGFTMRTIETLLSGKKLLTTNRSILNSNLFDPSRVFVIDRNKPEVEESFLDEPFVEVDEELKRYYSCSGWVSELLALQESARAEGQNNKAPK
jgi:hypothetical protein